MRRLSIFIILVILVLKTSPTHLPQFFPFGSVYMGPRQGKLQGAADNLLRMCNSLKKATKIYCIILNQIICPFISAILGTVFDEILTSIYLEIAFILGLTALEWASTDGVPVSGAGSTSKSSQTIYI